SRRGSSAQKTTGNGIHRLSSSVIVNYLHVKIKWITLVPKGQVKTARENAQVNDSLNPDAMQADTLDVFIAEWKRQRPDLDFDYLSTLGRILRVSAHVRESMDRWLAPFGLTWEMFDLLASLQRSGSKNGLRPTDLY